METPDAGWLGRTARAQKFGWNPDNSPDFGRPRGFGISLELPSSNANDDDRNDDVDSGSGITPKSITSITFIYSLTKIIMRF